MTLAFVFAASYVLGAVPMSLIAARLGAGIDLREHGSKNLGATNLFRVLGWKYAVPVGLFDIGKGTVAVLFIAPFGGTAPWIPLVTGIAAILGHVFSAFVGVRGGKGVATAAGVVLGLAPAALAASFATWFVVLKATGYVSLASMLGAVIFPVATLLWRPANPYTLWVGIGMAAFIVFTHRANIRRLLSGTESRFGHREA